MQRAVEDHTNGTRHTYLTKRRLPLGKNNDFAYFLQIIGCELYSGRYTLKLNLAFKAEGLYLWDSWQENHFGLEQGFSVT